MSRIKLSSKKILSLLREHDSELKNRFSVEKIGLFGSYVRDKSSKKSDIDILVELNNITFDNYMDLKFYLEELLGRNVDLVMSDSIKPRLKQYIMSEVQFAQRV